MTVILEINMTARICMTSGSNSSECSGMGCVRTYGYLTRVIYIHVQ